MSKDSNIVHQYYRKDFGDMTILVKVNPIVYNGIELTLQTGQAPVVRDMAFDAGIFDDLAADGFEAASPLEFNLYYSGLA